jgi:cell wall-associated NlpC family hydrolase
MAKSLRKTFLLYALSLCMILGMLMTTGTKEVAATYSRYVTASSLNIRKSASTSSKIVGHYYKGDKVTCYGTSGSFTKVKYSGYYRYVATQYLSKTNPSVSTYSRYVTASSLNIRKSASTSSKIVGHYYKGDKVTCYGTSGSFTKVKYNGYYRYVSTQYLASSKPSTGTTSATGQAVADYAVRFVGNPYKWGGESLTNGADCSGFTKAVFAHFGYSLPHNSVDQRSYGSSVSWANKKIGDLICYNKIDGVGHVGIYIGNNQVVHAGSSSTGIHISKADYRSVWGVRRIVK